MISLTKALQVGFVEERGDAQVYCGDVAKEWSFRAPQGGYALGLLVSACMSAQAQTNQRDIIHVTGHFLHVAAYGKFEVHVRTIRKGFSYSNISAELIQNNQAKITAQFIFGTLPDKISPNSPFTILPPSPYARRVPLHLHPSVAPVTPMWRDAKFFKAVKWAEDKELREHNRALGRGERPALGDGGLEWGAWMELTDPSENLDVALLPFLADMFKSGKDLLPKDPRQLPTWTPTMVLSLEYKAKIPHDPAFSQRTVGLYSYIGFLHEGRQDVYVEVWTSPSEIGQGAEENGWREKQVCLAIAYQMGVTVPISVNERKVSLANGKL